MTQPEEPLPAFLAEPSKIGQEISVTGKWIPTKQGGLFRKSAESKEMLKEWGGHPCWRQRRCWCAVDRNQPCSWRRRGACSPRFHGPRRPGSLFFHYSDDGTWARSPRSPSLSYTSFVESASPLLRGKRYLRRTCLGCLENSFLDT